MVQFFFPIIAVLSFGPALLLLYFSLSKYTWPKADKPYFDDRWIFAFLAVGIIAGALLAFAQEQMAVSGGGFAFVILFVIIEQLLVLIVLNFPRVRRKGSGRFYGYSFGTSIAAGIALGEYGIVFSGAAYFDIPTLLILLVYTVGSELLGGATGSVIGYSVEEGLIARGVSVSVSLQVIFNFLLIPVFSFRPSVLTMLFDLAAFAVSAVTFVVVIYRVLPKNLGLQNEVHRKRLM